MRLTSSVWRRVSAEATPQAQTTRVYAQSYCLDRQVSQVQSQARGHNLRPQRSLGLTRNAGATVWTRKTWNWVWS